MGPKVETLLLLCFFCVGLVCFQMSLALLNCFQFFIFTNKSVHIEKHRGKSKSTT